MVNNKTVRSVIVFTAILLCMLQGCSYSVTVSKPQDTATHTVTETADVTESESETETAPEPDPALVEDKGKNLITTGDFSSDNGGWGLYTQSGGNASVDITGGKLVVRIADPGRVGHGVQLYYDGFELLERGQYEFSAEISSDVSRTFEWRVQINGSDYHPYYSMKEIEIGPDPVTITATFTMKEHSDPAPRMCFNIGDENSSQGLGGHNIYLDNVSLILINDSSAKAVEREGELMEINLNQIGYHPNDEKRAVIRNSSNGDEKFTVIDVQSKETVFEGEVKPGTSLGSSGDNVAYADLTAFKTPGTYKISTKNSGESYDFTIDDNVYDEALKDSIRMLYLQRCGCELPESLAGDFAHAACHTEEARIYGSKRYASVTGGWHDAGDYGRYTVPGVKAVADLLLAYENYPEAFKDTINIPESGNGIPDVLNEARYELEWLLKMQAPDGGVYHKVTGLNFDGFIKADECTEPLYILPESKTASADFAAIMYMAARVYKDFDKEFAAKCENAAGPALSAYIAHINDRNYTNPEDVNTGEYPDGSSVDEFFWAICEGYKTTGDSRFAAMIDKVDFSRIESDGFGWDDMSGYAFYAYMTSKDELKVPVDIKGRFMEMCSALKDTALNGEAYGCTITDDYPWGSNMYVANNAMALLMAHQLTGDDDYRLAAKRQLDYLLGTNTTSYCFLTGYGTQAPQHPHHRPSQAIGKCMKGMLVGGPNSRLEDPYAKTVLANEAKAKCYVDNDQSYSCNEVTIYWNSPLVYVLAGLK